DRAGGDERLFRQHGDAEHQREFEQNAQRRRPARPAGGRGRGGGLAGGAGHRRLLRPNSARGSVLVTGRAAGVAAAGARAAQASRAGSSSVRADEPPSGECPARALIELPRWPLASLASAVRGASLRCASQSNRRAAGSSAASIIRISRAGAISALAARWML